MSGLPSDSHDKNTSFAMTGIKCVTKETVGVREAACGHLYVVLKGAAFKRC